MIRSASLNGDMLTATRHSYSLVVDPIDGVCENLDKFTEKHAGQGDCDSFDVITATKTSDPLPAY